MDENVAIKVDKISKVFKLPHEKNTSIKSAVVNFYKPHKKGYELQKALSDISFEVKKGEFFGIVGRNGSGKSTLLKIISQIYTPTEGKVRINGTLTPFIELGVGFNPELTGRENVYLNGALLGFSRADMRSMYRYIVEFAELDRFMDQKLKNYSSGMHVRLAFSIAIQAKSDILILDEVLAVGDEAFQQKCIAVFEKYKAEKKTIVIVTHDMSVVEKFCNRAMLIKDSKVVKIGNPQVVAQMYSEFNQEDYLQTKRLEEDKKSQLRNVHIDTLSHDRRRKDRFIQGENLLVRVGWEREDVQNVGVAIVKRSGEYIFGPNTFQDKFELTSDFKEVYCSIELPVTKGEYFIMAGLFGSTDREMLEFIEEGPSFVVQDSKSEPKWGGVVKLAHKWSDK
jgi:ABC-2 type transport system ATP-binding protein